MNTVKATVNLLHGGAAPLGESALHEATRCGASGEGRSRLDCTELPLGEDEDKSRERERRRMYTC